MTYNLPKRRKRQRAGIRPEPQLRCEAHRQFIRGHMCILFQRRGHACWGKTEAAHVRTGTDGGTGVKPSDNFTVPMCSAAHRQQHDIGEAAFEKKWGIDMRAIADGLAKISPALRKLKQRTA